MLQQQTQAACISSLLLSMPWWLPLVVQMNLHITGMQSPMAAKNAAYLAQHGEQRSWAVALHVKQDRLHSLADLAFCSHGRLLPGDVQIHLNDQRQPLLNDAVKPACGCRDSLQTSTPCWNKRLSPQSKFC